MGWNDAPGRQRDDVKGRIHALERQHNEGQNTSWGLQPRDYGHERQRNDGQ